MHLSSDVSMKGRHYRRFLVLGTIMTIGLTLLIATSHRCIVWSSQCIAVEDVDDISNNVPIIRKFVNLVQNISKPAPSQLSAYNMTQSRRAKDYISLQEAMQDRANSDNVIVLASVDYGYVNFARNLYETSFLRLGIDNYLFVSSDSRATSLLKSLGISSVMIGQDRDGGKASAYGSRAFIRKTHLKTMIVLEALKLGYTVLIVDLDIVFLESPFKHFNCHDCDIEIQLDGTEGNSGFYLAQPTNSSIILHQEALSIGQKSKWLSNQKAVDRIMEEMSKEGVLKFQYLDSKKFPHGERYFEQGQRMFAGDNPCRECIIVHNNWIVGGDAKEYRFKENLMWVVDQDQYYSSPTRKYLLYENPIDFGSWHTTAFENEALRIGLSISRLLNRTLILPMFHCYGCRYQPCKNKDKHCSLNTHIRLETFNNLLRDKYREHMFLNHPKVPESTKRSLSPVILIANAKVKAINVKHVHTLFTPRDVTSGASAEEFLQWMETFSHFSVLRFHSLYSGFSGVFPRNETISWNLKLKMAMKSADYRQY